MLAVTCERCGVKLFGDEVALGRCENCDRHALPARYVATAPRPYADYLRPRRESFSLARPLASGWATVRSGITLLRWSMGCYFSGLGIVVLALFLSMGIREAAMLLLLPAGLLVVTSVILGLVGICMLAWVPQESGVKGCAIGLVSCLAITLLVDLFKVVLLVGETGQPSTYRSGPGPEETLMMLAGGLTLLTSFIAWVCAFFFFHGVARYFKDRSLANGWLTFFIVSLVGPIVAVVLAVMLGAAAGASRSDDGAVAVLVLLLLGIGVGCLVMVCALADLLRRTRDLIPERASFRDW